MDRQGLQLNPSDLKAPAPTRDDIRNPRPPRRRFDGWRKKRHWGRWLVGAFFLLGLISSALEDEGGTEQAAAPLPRVAALPDDPIVSGYLQRVQVVCRERNQLISQDPGLTPMDEILRFQVETTSLIAAVPHPTEAADVRRVLLQARRRVDRLTLRAYRAMAASPTPTRTFNEEYAPLVRRTVSETYSIFAGLGVDCDTGTV